MFVFCRDLHASNSFHSTRPASVVCFSEDGFCLLKDTRLCGYTQVVRIDEAACIIGYRLVVCIDIE